MPEAEFDSRENLPVAGIARWLVPAIIIGLAVTAFWMTTDFDRVPPILKRGMQPSDFPQLVCGLIIALAIVMMVRDRPLAAGHLHRTVYFTLGLLCLFLVIAPVDFFLALGCFAASLSFAWGERRIGALTGVGVVLPVLVFFLFDQVFEIRFPRGLLTNLWYG